MDNTLYALMIEKPFVLRNDITYAKAFLKMLDRKRGKDAHNRVALYVDGYNDVVEELYEIPEVKKWVRKLINEVPHLWYYIHKSDVGDIAWIMNCLSDDMAMMTREGRKPISSYPLDEVRRLPKIYVHVLVSRKLINRMKEATIKHAWTIDDSEGGEETIEFIEGFFNDEHI
jgi:hypothetical protein